MSKVSGNKNKSPEVTQFINKLNSSNAEKMVRFKGLFDKNSDGKINDSDVGKETELFENFLYNASEYSAKFKSIIKNLNNLSETEYGELKKYLNDNNGKLPEWFLSDAKSIQKEEKKYSKNLYVSGENEQYKRVQDFHDFDEDITYYREREYNVHSKFVELATKEGNKIQTEELSDYGNSKIIIDKENKPLFSLSYDTNGNIYAHVEYKDGKIYSTTFDKTYRTEKIINQNPLKLESKIMYNKDIKISEQIYDSKERISKQIIYNNDKQNEINSISEYKYNDFSYTETWIPNLNKADASLYLEHGIATKIVKEYNNDNKKTKESYYSGDRLITENFYDEMEMLKTKKTYDPISGELKDTENLVYEDKSPKMEENTLEAIDIPESIDEIDDVNDIDEDGNDEVEDDGEDINIDEETPDTSIETGEDTNAGEKIIKPKPQGARSSFKDITTLNELRDKTEYIRNLNYGNTEDIKDMIKLLQSPDSAKLLAGERYANTPYANNGIKVMTNILNKMKNHKMDRAERARSVDFIYKMITNNDYYIRNSYIDKPNGKLDKPRYQNEEGDCWLLETANALNRKPKGRELLDEILEPDPKTDGAIVHLDGGKKHYRVTLKQLSEAFPLSSGEYDMRAIEIALNRYRNDDIAIKQWIRDDNYVMNTGETDYRRIYGGHAHEALEAFTGNKTLTASVENGILGVKINDEFVPINKENTQRLRRIPLIIPATTENLESLKQYGDDVVIYAGMDEHQYSMEFNNYGDLETHEPWNSENSKPFASKEIVSRSTKKQIDIMFL